MTSCSVVSSDEFFYAYHFPGRNSANTGYANPNALSIYTMLDAGGKVYLVMSVDAPGNSIPGLNALDPVTFAAPRVAHLSIAMTGAPPNTVQAVVKDDADDVQWDSDTNTGTMTWGWARCCTDGAVLGPIPAEGFSIDFELTRWFAQFTTIRVRGRAGAFTGASRCGEGTDERTRARAAHPIPSHGAQPHTHPSRHHRSARGTPA